MGTQIKLLTDAKKAIKVLTAALDSPVTESNYIERLREKKAAVEAGDKIVKAIEEVEK